MSQLGSTVLSYVMKLLNERHNYGLNLQLLAIDEGISGYRDDSLAALSRFASFSGLPFRVVSYQACNFVVFNNITLDM